MAPPLPIFNLQSARQPPPPILQYPLLSHTHLVLPTGPPNHRMVYLTFCNCGGVGMGGWVGGCSDHLFAPLSDLMLVCVCTKGYFQVGGLKGGVGGVVGGAVGGWATSNWLGGSQPPTAAALPKKN